MQSSRRWVEWMAVPAAMPRFKSKSNFGNKPHRGEGQWSRPRRVTGDTNASAHVKQRENSGYSDSKGYRGKATNRGAFGPTQPRPPREAGHFHPIHGMGSKGLMGDVSETSYHGKDGYTPRELGRHTGKSPRGDTNLRRGAQGNSKGSAPPGTNKSRSRNGTPDNHLGTAGRGGRGSLTQMHSNALSESPGHEWFESLGSK